MTRAGLALLLVACHSNSSGDDSSPSLDASTWVDCVGTLHVIAQRGYAVSNAERLGDSTPSLDAGSRIADLSAANLRAFCDWQACVRTNGYGHICFVNDAGWERCRVCDGSADCSGLPMSQDDCIAHAPDPTQAQCHVGLLEECLLQRAIRLPTDPRVTETCSLSAQACAEQLPGDLSAEAVNARQETEQVTIEECERELALTAQIDGSAESVASWDQQFSAWDGGLAVDDVDAAAEGGAAPGDASNDVYTTD